MIQEARNKASLTLCTQFAEKSDDAFYAQALCSVFFTFCGGNIVQNWQMICIWTCLKLENIIIII